MKGCTKCGQLKNLSEFPVWKNGRESARCRKCLNEKAVELYHKNKEQRRIKAKKYYEKNKERLNEKQRKYFLSNKEKIKEYQRKWRAKPEVKKRNLERAKNWINNNRERFTKYASKWKRENKEKSTAHQYVLWAIRLGVISKPEGCEKCKSKIKLESHHTDYSKPLEVIWLCRRCHLKEHGKELVNDSSSSRFQS